MDGGPPRPLPLPPLRTRQAPSRVRRPFLWVGLIVLWITLALIVGAWQGSRWHQRQSGLAAASLRNLAAAGVPVHLLQPLEGSLARLDAKRIGPIPLAWFGPVGTRGAWTRLDDQIARARSSGYAAAKSRAHLAGQAWAHVAAPWEPGAATEVDTAVGRASTPKAWDQLAAHWNAERQAWTAALARLATVSGGWVGHEPQDVADAVAVLDRRRADLAPGSAVSGTVAAALRAARTYLASIPPLELSGHTAVMTTLDAALAASAPPPLPAGDQPVPAAVRQYLATRQGDVSIALFNEDTGAMEVYNPDDAFETASIVKVTIMATLLWQAEQTHTPLTAEETSLMAPMIEVSNDDDATTLWFLAGGNVGIGRFLTRAGMNATHPGLNGYWGLTETTAADQVRLLDLLTNPNTVLDSAAQAYAAGLMEHVVGWERWGVTGGVPSNVTVALKNGWLPVPGGWDINSIGHVEGDGQNYLLALLSSGNPTEAYGIETLDQVSALLWQSLS